jgi:hypothetical protein
MFKTCLFLEWSILLVMSSFQSPLNNEVRHSVPSSTNIRFMALLMISIFKPLGTSHALERRLLIWRATSDTSFRLVLVKAC